MSWPIVIRLGEIGRGERRFAFEADARGRAELVDILDLASLDHFSGEVVISPWLDGARIEGRYQAVLEQICGITAEPLPVTMSGDFSLRVVPPGSTNAPQPDNEIDIDPDAEDPPDVLEDDVLDLTGYAVEFLALDSNPFPRKEGVEFVAPAQSAEISPFAALKGLQIKDKGE